MVNARHQTLLVLVLCFALLILVHFTVFRRPTESIKESEPVNDEEKTRKVEEDPEEEYPWGLGALMRVATAEDDASRLAMLAEQHVKRIRDTCGEVCRVATARWSEADRERGVFARKRFDCGSLFADNSVHDTAGAYFRAEVPKRVSANLLSHFTHEGLFMGSFSHFKNKVFYCCCKGSVRLSLEYKAFGLQPPREDWAKDYVDSMVRIFSTSHQLC